MTDRHFREIAQQLEKACSAYQELKGKGYLPCQECKIFGAWLRNHPNRLKPAELRTIAQQLEENCRALPGPHQCRENLLELRSVCKRPERRGLEARTPESGDRESMTEEQAKFDGWAILEIFGHQRFAGYVHTQYFGQACMLRLDVPALPGGRRRTLKYGERIGERYVEPGATVEEGPTEPYTKLFGIGAVYSMTPCDQQTAYKAVETLQPRPLTLVSLPPGKPALAAPVPLSRDFTCCGGNPEDGHMLGCPWLDNEPDGDEDLDSGR